MRKPLADGPLPLVAGILAAAAIAASAFALKAQNIKTPDDGTAVPSSAADAAPSAHIYTKQEFEQHLLNRTKAQIRDELGSPRLVYDGTDTWFYEDPPVVDAQAGTKASGVSVRFAGIDGDQDFVADVSYQ